MKQNVEYTKGLSVALGAFIGFVIGAQLAGTVTGIAVGAAVGIAIYAVLDHEMAPKKKSGTKKKR